LIVAAIERIENSSQLDTLLERSKERRVWIFKHSLTCSISAHAWLEFRRFAESVEGDVVFALIEVQAARPVSNAVAQRLGIRHQSPQAILLREGAVAWHASHFDIELSALRQVDS
jgi:bacillithiol system protein YtxJ